MPAGAKLGERRGGRAKGTPNKATIAKAEAAQRTVAEARGENRELAVDALRRYATLAEGAAAEVKPTSRAEIEAGKEPRSGESWSEFHRWLKFAADCHKEVMMTETPKLMVIAVANAPPPTAKVTRIKLRVFEAAPAALEPPKEIKAEIVPADEVPEESALKVVSART